MGAQRRSGPTCNVRNWFAEPIADGTLTLLATPPPGPSGREPTRTAAGFWLPPFQFAPLGKPQGEFADLEQRVLDTHILRAQRRNGEAAAEILEKDLQVVEGHFKLRAGPAVKCRALLASARADLEVAKKTGAARMDVSFGLTSAYRGPEYDKHLWQAYFLSKYYRSWLSKGQVRVYYGQQNYDCMVQAALEDLVAYIAPRKAAPGYSNHTRGIAVDFWTRENGILHQAATGKGNAGMEVANQAWQTTWFYRWLENRKKTYGMDRIKSEAWHWEFK